MKNPLNKKTFFGAIALLLAFNFAGCDESRLEITNPNEPSADTFWRNQDDAESGVIAVYASLPTVWSYGRFIPGIFSIQRSDIANTFPQGNVNEAGTFSNTPDFPRGFDIWREFYTMIAAANQVIDRVPDIEDIDPTRQAEILGEAHFMRGLAYFNLVNQWGSVPMPLAEVTSVEEVFLVKSGILEIWATIESDFTIAQNSLPQTPFNGEAGRATWGAATGMLGKSFLYQEKWSEAAAEFRKVIDSGVYQLVANYGDNVSEAGVNNAESLFEAQLDGNPNGSWGGAGGNVFRGQGWEADIAPRGFTSQQSMSVNQWVLDLFLAQTTNGGLEDPRARQTLVWNYPGAVLYQDVSFTDAYQGEDLDRVWVRKYLNFENPDALNPGRWGGDTNNFRILRYADVLLMYAEAENEVNGGSTDALHALNQVRRRVDMPDYTGLDQTNLRNAIRDERVRELALEGHRWFDLKRWGILAERFGNNPEFKSNSQGVYQPKHEFLPLPQVEVDANPNLEQNPLWE